MADIITRNTELIRHVLALDPGLPILATDAYDYSIPLRQLSEQARSLHVATFFNPDAESGAYRDFYNAFFHRYGREPDFWALQGYDSVTLLLLAFFCAWGAFGKIPQRVAGTGVLVNGGGSAALYAPADGTVSDVSVRQDMTVAQNDTLVRVETGNGEILRVRTAYAGRVASLKVQVNQPVRAGDELARVLIQSGSADWLSAVCYVPLPAAGAILPGMEMEIYPVGLNTDDVGHMRALVTSRVRYPAGGPEQRIYRPGARRRRHRPGAAQFAQLPAFLRRYAVAGQRLAAADAHIPRRTGRARREIPCAVCPGLHAFSQYSDRNAASPLGAGTDEHGLRERLSDAAAAQPAGLYPCRRLGQSDAKLPAALCSGADRAPGAPGQRAEPAGPAPGPCARAGGTPPGASCPLAGDGRSGRVFRVPTAPV